VVLICAIVTSETRKTKNGGDNMKKGLTELVFILDRSPRGLSEEKK
jgi:hypothetical protein